ncbi:hypothetical protein I4U23_015942 [Adineta vaga]|nr:hypothetical protein I4U23_015942 [Adineta vaga]
MISRRSLRHTKFIFKIYLATQSTATRNTNRNISYGHIDGSDFYGGTGLNSVLLFNSQDHSNVAGYINSVNVRFSETFKTEFTRDGSLWFFITDGISKIKGRYPVIPSNISLIQSFSIPQHALFMEPSDHSAVCALSISSDSDKLNRIGLQRIGNYFWSPISSITENILTHPTILERISLTVSYVVTYKL